MVLGTDDGRKGGATIAVTDPVTLRPTSAPLAGKSLGKWEKEQLLMEPKCGQERIRCLQITNTSFCEHRNLQKVPIPHPHFLTCGSQKN